MIFEGNITLGAEPPKVWGVLLDVNQFAACMPGVQEVTKVDDGTFDGTISAAVGPIAGKFSFRAHIVESDPPREMVAHVEGTDSVTKSTMKAEMTITLALVSADQTELTYRATVDIKGRLALLGDMVLRATAALMLDEFAKRLGRQVEGEETLAPA